MRRSPPSASSRRWPRSRPKIARSSRALAARADAPVPRRRPTGAKSVPARRYVRGVFCASEDRGRGRERSARVRALQQLARARMVGAEVERRRRARSPELPQRPRHAGRSRPSRATAIASPSEARASSSARRDEVGRDPQLAVRRDRRRRHPRQHRQADRRHLLHRHRFPPRPAPGRPLHRRLRDDSSTAEPVRSGRVLAAEFVNQGKTFRAVHSRQRLLRARRQEPAQGLPALAARILPHQLRLHHARSTRSSGAGARTRASTTRRRPARACERPPTASSISPAPKGGYGNVVILRHHGQYTTLYAHLEPHRACSAARASRRATPSATSARPAGHRPAPALRIPHRRPGSATRSRSRCRTRRRSPRRTLRGVSQPTPRRWRSVWACSQTNLARARLSGEAQYKAKGSPGSRFRLLQLSSAQAENDDPQPQVEVAFGFLITNCAPSRFSW